MTSNYFSTSALLVALTAPAFAVEKSQFLNTYADIAAAKYEDSSITAKTLQTAVDTLTSAPSAENLQTAKAAWFAASVPYQQSEVYRFGNAIVDDW